MVHSIRQIRVLLPFRPLTVKSVGTVFKERRFANRSVTKFIWDAESRSTRHGYGVLHKPSTKTTAVESKVCFVEFPVLAHRVVDVPATGFVDTFTSAFVANVEEVSVGWEVITLVEVFFDESSPWSVV